MYRCLCCYRSKWYQIWYSFKSILPSPKKHTHAHTHVYNPLDPDPAGLCGRRHRTWAGNQNLQQVELDLVSCSITEIFYRIKQKKLFRILIHVYFSGQSTLGMNIFVATFSVPEQETIWESLERQLILSYKFTFNQNTIIIFQSH